MSTVVVLASPPREGFVCDRLVDATPLSAAQAAELYAASLRDTLRAAERAGGDLLVNYLPEAELPEQYHTDTAPEAEIRTLASEALSDVTAARFERQVGSTTAARVGNTVTHLLREEAADSVAVLRPTAPLVQRSDVDGGAMKLRSSPVVLGPTATGDVYHAGFTEPVEFADAFADPSTETLTARARDADFDVDFLDVQPTVDDPTGLRAVVSLVRARVRAERVAPADTAVFVDDHGLRVRDGELVLDE